MSVLDDPPRPSLPLAEPLTLRGRAAWRAAQERVRAHPWPVAALALLALAFVLVRWSGTLPGYDPYGWLVWGKLTLHWKLDTNGAPSWKPLPFVFTVPMAVLGHYALWLWMTFAEAVSLSAGVFAWRIAWRLVDAPPERRYAAYAAGLTAAIGVFGIQDYTHYIFSAQSDTMIVATSLAAVDCALHRRYRWALWLWVAGALGRPEVWPFLGLYAVWAWRAQPSMRAQIAAGLLSVPVLWFGIPALTAKSWNVAGNNALHSPREVTGNKVTGTLDRFRALEPAILHLEALLGLALAVLARGWRSRRLALGLAAMVALWMLVEVAFALHGFPAVPRYMFEASGFEAALAGVAIGRLILELPDWIVRQPVMRRTPQVAGWATGAVVLACFGALLPVLHQREIYERHDLVHERARTAEINRLATVVRRLGPARMLACGQPNIPIGYQSVLAWYMDVKVGELYYSPRDERRHPHPTLDMYPLANGWQVVPGHIRTAAQHARCAPLALYYAT